MYTPMVKDPFRKWDRVDTVCALLVDLGNLVLSYLILSYLILSNLVLSYHI